MVNFDIFAACESLQKSFDAGTQITVYQGLNEEHIVRLTVFFGNGFHSEFPVPAEMRKRDELSLLFNIKFGRAIAELTEMMENPDERKNV